MKHAIEIPVAIVKDGVPIEGSRIVVRARDRSAREGNGEVMKNKRPICRACKHDKHRGKGAVCNYGEGIGTAVAICICDGTTAASKPKDPAPAAPKKIVGEADTHFAAALDEAAAHAHAMGDALAKAAKEARIARAEAEAVLEPMDLPPMLAKPQRRAPNAAELALGEGAHVGFDPPPPTPVVVDAAASLAIATLQDSDRKVLAALNAYPEGATRMQIVAVTALSDRTISDSLGRLRGVGLVERGATAITPEGARVHAANPTDLPVIVLAGAQRDVLAACAFLGERGTRRLLALHTKLSDRSIADALSWLRTHGYVKAGTTGVTEEGATLTRGFAPPIGGGAELVSGWTEICEGADRKIFALFVDSHPGSRTREEIEDRTELSARTISDSVGRLRMRYLVDKGKLAVSSEIAEAIDAR